MTFLQSGSDFDHVATRRWKLTNGGLKFVENKIIQKSEVDDFLKTMLGGFTTPGWTVQVVRFLIGLSNEIASRIVLKQII